MWVGKKRTKLCLDRVGRKEERRGKLFFFSKSLWWHIRLAFLSLSLSLSLSFFLSPVPCRAGFTTNDDGGGNMKRNACCGGCLVYVAFGYMYEEFRTTAAQTRYDDRLYVPGML